MKIFLYVAAVVLVILLYFLYRQGSKKNVWIWLGSYVKQKMKGKPEFRRGEPIHIFFCVVDHFEPIQEGYTKAEEWARMNAWIKDYPQMAGKHADSNGRVPQHTWFYPGEAYESEYLEGLVGLCKMGYGDIEFHHHHYYESSKGLREKIRKALNEFAQHGVFVTDNGSSALSYGFIHGNMALDNSRYEDKWCGVNDELTILKETGCYADFSSPTAPANSQARKINAIYYATDDPAKPKSHDTGIDVEVGGKPAGDLMIIQGPLAPNWVKRKYGILPTIDNGEIHNNAPGTPDRIERWIRQAIHVRGKPNWVFVKASCHGAQDENYDVLLGRQADQMYTYLEERYRNRERYKLHYVTAREFYNIVKAAEAGQAGNPVQYYDYSIPRYRYR